jgi:hypothetical protein
MKSLGHYLYKAFPVDIWDIAFLKVVVGCAFIRTPMMDYVKHQRTLLDQDVVN